MRKVKLNDQWYYSIEDVIQELAGTSFPNDYLKNLRHDHKEIDWDELTTPLPIPPDKEILQCIDEAGVELLKRVIPEKLNKEDLSEFNKKLDRALNFNPKK
jgi:hypothetical protein